MHVDLLFGDESHYGIFARAMGIPIPVGVSWRGGLDEGFIEYCMQLYLTYFLRLKLMGKSV